MISTENIEMAGYEIMKKAAIDIPDDYLQGIKAVSYTHLTLPTTPYV